MRRLLSAALLALLPYAARATCVPTSGPLTLNKIRLGDPSTTWVGCVNTSLDTLSASSATLNGSTTTPSYFGAIYVNEIGGRSIGTPNILISSPIYSTDGSVYTSWAGSVAVRGAGGLGVTYGLSAGSATVSGGLTASSGTFTATGNTQYSVATSSGISVTAGMVTAPFFVGPLRGNADTATSATSATSATTATNLANGGVGQHPYQTGSGATSFLPAAAAGGLIVGNGTGAVPSTAAVTAAFLYTSAPATFGLDSSSVAVLNASHFVQNFQIDGSSITKLNSSGLVPNVLIDGSSVTKLNSSGLVPNSLIDGSSVTKLNASGLVPNSLLDASSVTKQGNAFNAASQLVKTDANNGIAVASAALTGNYFSVGGSSFIVNGGSVTAAYQLGAGSYKVGSTAGATISCSGGQVLQGPTITGGIATAGSCGTAGSGDMLSTGNNSMASGASITFLAGSSLAVNGTAFSGPLPYSSSGTWSAVTSSSITLPSVSSATYILTINPTTSGDTSFKLGMSGDTGTPWHGFGQYQSVGGTTSTSLAPGAYCPLTDDAPTGGNAPFPGWPFNETITITVTPSNVDIDAHAGYRGHTTDHGVVVKSGCAWNIAGTTTPSTIVITLTGGITMSGWWTLQRVN